MYRRHPAVSAVAPEPLSVIDGLLKPFMAAAPRTVHPVAVLIIGDTFYHMKM